MVNKMLWHTTCFRRPCFRELASEPALQVAGGAEAGILDPALGPARGLHRHGPTVVPGREGLMARRVRAPDRDVLMIGPPQLVMPLPP
jgi:hypothetical protein